VILQQEIRATSWCGLAAGILVRVLDLSRRGDEDRLYDALMEDAGELTFQARMDQKLVKASLRRALLPIGTGVAAATLAIAALLYGAGDPGGWALPVLGGGALGIVVMLFAVPELHRARGQILLSHHGRSDSKRRMSIIPTGDLTVTEHARLLAVLRSRGTALTHAPTV
jgi:hypothetical protein